MVQNWLHYRSFSPPEYDLKKVDVPVALIWSDNDWLADPKVRDKISEKTRISIRKLEFIDKDIFFSPLFHCLPLGCEVHHQQFAETCDELAGALS